MGKHTQAIRRQKPTNCLSVLDHFMGLVLKEFNASFHTYFETRKNIFSLLHGVSVLLVYNQNNLDLNFLLYLGLKQNAWQKKLTIKTLEQGVKCVQS